MAILDEIFGAQTLGTDGGSPIDSMYMREALMKALKTAGVDMDQLMGNTVSDPSKVAQAPPPTVEPAPRPQVGTPYTPPAPEQAPADVRPRNVDPRPIVAPPTEIPGLPAHMAPTWRDRLMNVGEALQGRTAANLDRSHAQMNMTYQALAKMVGPEKAALAISNPQIMQAMAPVLFGAKQGGEWKEIGKDKYGSPQYGFVNSTAQTVTPYGAAPGSPAAGPDLAGLTGKDLLDKLDPGDRNTVLAIIEGRQAPATLNARPGSRGARIMEWVAAAEPGFDMTQWKARNQARTEYAGNRPGTPGFNLTALGTAMGHLEQVQEMGEKLDNLSFPGSTLLRENVTNPIARNLEGLSDFNEREAAFNTKKKAALDEVSRVFVGGVGSVFDRKSWEEKLQASQTPGQLNATIKSMVDLMKGRAEELVGSYNRTLGTERTLDSFLSPEGAARMHKVLGDAQPGATPTPPPANVGEGTVIQDRGGRRMMMRGGQWRPI